MVEWIHKGKFLICPPERSLVILPADPSTSKSGESERKNDGFLLKNLPFITRRAI
jgi:hypothetical protein